MAQSLEQGFQEEPCTDARILKNVTAQTGHARSRPVQAACGSTCTQREEGVRPPTRVVPESLV